ncbi:hypothetical protein ACFE04_026855 [Oxalis oulophora]
MVSKNPNPTEGFYMDPTGMALPVPGGGIGPFITATDCSAEDPNKKIRKPYTITKSRESWTEPEHDKFLEALQLFDRDWKKIEAFVGSKTVIQIRSHAQKYFQKVQKSGANEHLPPPRPKRKAAHPYPQKAIKTGAKILFQGSNLNSQYDMFESPGLSQGITFFQPPPALEPGYALRPETSSMPMNHNAEVPSWTDAVQPDRLINPPKGKAVSSNCCSTTESTPRTLPTGVMAHQGTDRHQIKVLPDFAQVYTFIGNVFDPIATGHAQRLKTLDPIDVETVLLLMRNLSINLASPDFEDHRQLLSSNENDTDSINHHAAQISFNKDLLENVT